jgi:hypothetical protein
MKYGWAVVNLQHFYFEQAAFFDLLNYCLEMLSYHLRMAFADTE